jgi:tRNA U55 pseudouridine synthase TruB
MHSALKRDGQPLYKLRGPASTWTAARADRANQRLECLDFRPGVCAELDIESACSKGTYIRTLAMDIGEQLGVGGHVLELRRTARRAVCVEECVTLERCRPCVSATSWRHGRAAAHGPSPWASAAAAAARIERFLPAPGAARASAKCAL